MKTLPDVPSLDHLRQQAKDVLPMLRKVRPEAKLSDAQALVAEQYGFRTWPDLKAEVDRRCALVTRAADAVAAAVAAAFDLGAPAGPMVALGRQWAGQAWSLQTERGRWLGRQLFDWFEESAVEAEVLLAESASAAGIVTPDRSAPPRARSSWRSTAHDGASTPFRRSAPSRLFPPNRAMPRPRDGSWARSTPCGYPRRSRSSAG